MAALSPVNYETKFNDISTGQYRDGQGASAINPLKHRTLVTDTKDSFHNTQFISGSSFSAAFAIINLLETNFPQVIVSDTISSNIVITLSGDTFKPSFTFIFTTSGSPYLQFPSTFKSSDARWDNATKRFSPLEAGLYKARADWDGTSWLIDFSPSIYS
jgi:hypothetical protein